MSNRSYIPRKDEDFHTWQANFFQQLSPLATRLGIPTEKLTALQDRRDEWVDNWIASQAPATRTPLTIEKKTRARDLYEADIRAIVRQYLTYNDAVTNDDRVTLGLPIHKTTRTPVPVPDTIPAVTIKPTGIPRQLGIWFNEQGKTDNAKPSGVHGAEIRHALTAGNTPLTIKQLTHSEFDTHSPFKLTLEDEDRGKIVWIALRWENTRGEKGPWTDIFSAIVP